MVLRVYSEKKHDFAGEAAHLLADIKEFLLIGGVERVRVINRYDAEGISAALFKKCKTTVFSEPPVDDIYTTVSDAEKKACAAWFVYEALPGQFDQRADSAEQCIQLLSQGERPQVATAKMIMLYGQITADELAKIKKYVINPIECRETGDELPETLRAQYSVPDKIAVAAGFSALDEDGLRDFIDSYRLSMDTDDLRMCRDYFAAEKRDPTVTEIRVLDTYWSDHCRHTTFNTHLTDVTFADGEANCRVKAAYERYLKTREEMDREKPVTLMDIATAAVRYLRYSGKLTAMDESDEINACTVKTQIETDGRKEDWLLLFKNETHNHPTEIEPFGGAATCIGGAIRDPLSGRSYVYQAMRITGAADPTRDVSETIAGKLPQRRLVTSAAAGYSSYGNQIGLATGIVDEIYHDGYAAKHMEIGMVLGAVKAENVVRETPQPGDIVILLGGRTGRDGCGGATGSSKSHDVNSLSECGSEVQKGNAPEERKLQRLFRDPQAAKMIIRCNDFGAGGVSVAIGELADGVKIDLNKVPKKYEGLDSTELAISESQERMAVVVKPQNAERFCELAAAENIEATVVAEVTAEARLVMYYNGRKAADISREFLDTNGAPKQAQAAINEGEVPAGCGIAAGKSFAVRMRAFAGDLNICSKRALAERFDSTIGAATVFMPFGGRKQLTPIQVMAAKLPTAGHTDACSAASWGFNPYISEKSRYAGGYLAVTEAIAKLTAAGVPLDEAYLTLQEYFRHLGNDPTNWGEPFAALLGAFAAQLDFGIGAIGGKDSMSGSFEDISVPPTLVAFGAAMARASALIGNEFKSAGHKVLYIAPKYDAAGLPEAASARDCFTFVHKLIAAGSIVSAYALGFGGAAEAVLKMGAGNAVGFAFDEAVSESEIFDWHYGAFAAELSGDNNKIDAPDTVCVKALGTTTAAYATVYHGESVGGTELLKIYENKLDGVYPMMPERAGIAPTEKGMAYHYNRTARSHGAAIAVPKVLIPVFPGTNCEYDSARAFREAGAAVTVMPLHNLTAAAVADSAERFARQLAQSQILFLPGGFSAGDEPEGSAKFITAFLRNPQVAAEITALLDVRDGLIGGICNGFQALVKLGLVPYGRFTELTEQSPTLTFNTVGRHISKLVRTKIVSVKSPWLMYTQPGDIHTVAISHGEGRFIAGEKLIYDMAADGRIAAVYCDENGLYLHGEGNPNGSIANVECITSPDGRVFGKMAHSERCGDMIYKNVDGEKHQPIFKGAVDYFK